MSTQRFSVQSHRLIPFFSNQLFVKSTQHENIIDTNVGLDHGNMFFHVFVPYKWPEKNVFSIHIDLFFGCHGHQVNFKAISVETIKNK